MGSGRRNHSAAVTAEREPVCGGSFEPTAETASPRSSTTQNETVLLCASGPANLRYKERETNDEGRRTKDEDEKKTKTKTRRPRPRARISRRQEARRAATTARRGATSGEELGASWAPRVGPRRRRALPESRRASPLGLAVSREPPPPGKRPRAPRRVGAARAVVDERRALLRVRAREQRRDDARGVRRARRRARVARRVADVAPPVGEGKPQRLGAYDRTTVLVSSQRV